MRVSPLDHDRTCSSPPPLPLSVTIEEHRPICPNMQAWFKAKIYLPVFVAVFCTEHSRVAAKIYLEPVLEILINFFYIAKNHPSVTMLIQFV